MKKFLSNLIFILVFLVGLSLLLYPTVSDYWNSLHQSRAIAQYEAAVADIDHEEYDRILADARAYNRTLLGDQGRFMMTDEQRAYYQTLLNVSGNGIMGYIEIPRIDCTLPIYHGTGEAVLQVAVGHIEGSSLPVGGAGTHCVLSGHRGLPSAKLFTNLDKLKEGDTFLLRVLDEVLTYEVDQVLVVLPEEMDALAIEEEQDYCTLVTCTPYGINSHRLLVRGHRIETVLQEEDLAKPAADAVQTETEPVISPVLAAPVLLALLAILLVIVYAVTGKKRKK